MYLAVWSMLCFGGLLRGLFFSFVKYSQNSSILLDKKERFGRIHIIIEHG